MGENITSFAELINMFFFVFFHIWTWRDQRIPRHTHKKSFSFAASYGKVSITEFHHRVLLIVGNQFKMCSVVTS